MGKIVWGAKDKAEALNQQFISVFTKEDLSSLPHIGTSKIPCMPDIHITTSGVEKLLKNLQAHKVAGQNQTLNYNTISSNKDCYRYSLYPRTIPIWNSLPPQVKSAPDANNFNSLLENIKFE